VLVVVLGALVLGRGDGDLGAPWSSRPASARPRWCCPPRGWPNTVVLLLFAFLGTNTAVLVLRRDTVRGHPAGRTPAERRRGRPRD
jgi:hypothetical protein